MKLTHACVITDDVMRFRDFYADVLRMAPTRAKTPSTQPWGNRSIYFPDPDGNLVNLYARV